MDHKQIAREIMKSARTRAPSFIMLNHIASDEMNQRNLSQEDREKVIQAAHELQREEETKC